MKVIVSDEARAFVWAHGHTVFVDSHTHRCCTGPLTLLDATTKRPLDATDFDAIHIDKGIEVYFRDGPDGRPAQLGIELRGRIRPRLVASWDGCAYKL